jgi:outer membrane lipoprotein-sorting protein
MPDVPETNARVSDEWPMPKGEMHPMAVMTTRSRIGRLRYHGLFHGSTRVAGALVCVALVFSVLAWPADSGQTTDGFNDLFARVAARRTSLTSIRARFTETTQSTLLQRPLVAHGTIVGAPPTRVLMNYDDPERRVVAIDATQMVLAWPDRGQRETVYIAATQKRIEQYFTNAGADRLRALFAITVRPGARPSLVDVEMVPRRKQLQQGLAKLELSVNRETLLLEGLQMTFASGDVKTITLTDIVVNEPVSDEMFRVAP